MIQGVNEDRDCREWIKTTQKKGTQADHPGWSTSHKSGWQALSRCSDQVGETERCWERIRLCKNTMNIWKRGTALFQLCFSLRFGTHWCQGPKDFGSKKHEAQVKNFLKTALDAAFNDFVTKDGNCGLFWHLKNRIDYYSVRHKDLKTLEGSRNWWRDIAPDPLDCFQVWKTSKAKQAFIQHPSILIEEGKDDPHTRCLWSDLQKPIARILCSGEKDDLAANKRAWLKGDAEVAFKTIVDPRVVHWSATAGVKLAGVHYEAFGTEIEKCNEECLWQTKNE